MIATWIGYGFVLVAAAAEYVGRRRRARRISDTYRSAYASGAGLGDEFIGWENEGTWPEK